MGLSAFRWLCAFAVVMLCASVSRAGEGAFVVQPNQFIGPPLVGFGAQMNPYLYTRPNWGDVNDRNVKDLEEKVRELRPQLVRVFVAYEWKGGKPDDIDKESGPRMWQSFLRTLRLAQSAGATITLTTWWGHPADPERTARETVEMLSSIIRDDGIDAVKYINMMNEPNGDWPSEDPWTLERYNRLYRALDSGLASAGLRQRVKIITGDLVSPHQAQWMADIADHLADVTDDISIHVYWDYRKNNKIFRRLEESRRMASTQPAIAHKPLLVTEFGAQGEGCFVDGREPGNYENGTPLAQTTEQAIQIGEFMMAAVNRGYAGTCQWDMYDCWYDRLMHYGVIGGVADGWELRPAYYVLKMFTHTVEPGWRAVRVGGTESGMACCAMRGPNGELAVFVLNHNDGPREVYVEGLPAGNLRSMTWNSDGAGRLQESQGPVGGSNGDFLSGSKHRGGADDGVSDWRREVRDGLSGAVQIMREER